MDHEIRGVLIRVSGMRAIAQGKAHNGVEVQREASWAEVRALAGADIPGLGVALDVRVPRVNPVPAGTRINIITEP